MVLLFTFWSCILSTVCKFDSNFSCRRWRAEWRRASELCVVVLGEEEGEREGERERVRERG
jgi:hypothetical protein